MTWSPLARGYALAWEQNEREKCPDCRTRHEEWKDDPDAYLGATHYCRGSELLAQQRNTFPTDDDGRPMPGYFAYLKPRAQAEQEMEAEAARQMELEAAANAAASDDDLR